MRKLAPLALLALSVGAVACRPSVTHVHVDPDDGGRPKPGQFTVAGTATLEVPPDVADVRVTVTAEAPSARVAAGHLRTRQAELRRALEQAGLATADVVFSGLTLTPVYDSKSSRLTGYRASSTLTATTRDFAALPELLEVTVKAGATNVSTSARVLDLPARKREVRDMAIAAAKAKAEQTAAGVGVKLGRIVGISEGTGDDWRWNGVYSNAQAVFQGSGVGVGGGLGGELQSLTMTLSLTYEL